MTRASTLAACRSSDDACLSGCDQCVEHNLGQLARTLLQVAWTKAVHGLQASPAWPSNLYVMKLSLALRACSPSRSLTYFLYSNAVPGGAVHGAALSHSSPWHTTAPPSSKRRPARRLMVHSRAATVPPVAIQSGQRMVGTRHADALSTQGLPFPRCVQKSYGRL